MGKTAGGTSKIPPGLTLESNRYIVAPGQVTSIPLNLSNPGTSEARFSLAVRGAPAAWVSLPATSFHLAAGEKQTVLLVVHPPRVGTRSEHYPVTVTLTSETDATLTAEAQLSLLVGVSTGSGTLGILVGSTQFSITPGERTEVNFQLANRGQASDVFQVSLEGLPAEWFTLSSPQIGLAAGEQKSLTLAIHPPRSPGSRAGRHAFTLKVSSQKNASQSISLSCVLTIAAYMQFRSLLKPPRLQAGERGEVLVSNQGNLPLSVTVTLSSQDEAVQFTPEAPQELRVNAGEVTTAGFSAQPGNRSIFGDQVGYPIQAQVRSPAGESQTLNGFVVSRALIPIWVLPAILLICLGAVMVPLIAVFLGQIPGSGGIPIAQITQTAAVTQTASAMQTLAAESGQQDSDGDGLSNLQEAQLGTNPNVPDSDADALLDGAEVMRFGTDPLNPDTDSDGLSDGDEIRLSTFPTNPDTDMDGVNDGEEVHLNIDPRNPDTDGDSLTDGDEITRGTNPALVDSDGDGLNDGDEVRRSTNPLMPDTDNDRLNDGTEVQIQTNPLNPDTDGDGLIDGLDPDPLDPTNPSLTATSVAGRPTATLPIPTVLPSGTPTLFPTFPPASTPTLPPLSGTLLFTSNRDGNAEIYMNQVGNANALRLTDNPANDSQPALSPDTTNIAFTSNRDGNNEIYSMRPDGSGQTNLSNNPADDRDPSWSPDGAWIVFASNRTGNWDIYVMLGNGTQPRNITNTPTNEYQPVWFNDKQLLTTNQKIAFTTDREGDQEIYSMSIDGFNQINLTNHPADDNSPAASPAGDRILFVSNRDGNPDVFVMNTTGGNRLNLTSYPAQDLNPTWSGDGRWIAFTSDRTGNPDIFFMSPNGANVTNYIKSPSADYEPSWR